MRDTATNNSTIRSNIMIMINMRMSIISNAVSCTIIIINIVGTIIVILLILLLIFIFIFGVEGICIESIVVIIIYIPSLCNILESVCYLQLRETAIRACILIFGSYCIICINLYLTIVIICVIFTLFLFIFDNILCLPL